MARRWRVLVRTCTDRFMWLRNCGHVDWERLRTKLEFEAFVMIIIGQGVVGVVVARIDEVDVGLVGERREVFTAVVVVFLAYLLALDNDALNALILLLLAACFLPGLGVCRISIGYMV